MQVKIAGTPAAAFNLTKLRNAFLHKSNGSGVFEASQHPIIVGQAAYNSAYGTSFAASSNCSPIPNAPNPGFTVCDGFVRVNDTMSFGFNTLSKPAVKTTMPLQPKAIHDEMNSSTFDEFGRMQANLGVEAQPPNAGQQNVTLYPFVNPTTELINGTMLPKNAVTYDTNGNPVSDVKITPMTDANDGTQIWRITHNGVDTHPIHFHLYDVQILNRVTWDNIVIPTEPGELGWKETVRISPLEDTIVALRPIVPQIPWEVPNSIRNMNPAMPTGATTQFNNIDPQGNPTNPITNVLVNFGWGYVWHCHILSHEEMDMMRPQTLALPPVAPSGLTDRAAGRGWVQPQGRAELERQLHHRDRMGGAALGQPRQHVDQRHHHPGAAELAEHPPGADVHRSVYLQSDHHDAVLPRHRPEHGRLRAAVPEHDRAVDVQHSHHRPSVHDHGDVPAPTAPSRRPAQWPWAGAGVRPSRSRRTPATASPPWSWTPSTSRPR